VVEAGKDASLLAEAFARVRAVESEVEDLVATWRSKAWSSRTAW
jgi:hypothetical protein